MKTVEAPGGIPTFLNLYENRMYEKITDTVCKDELSEREIHLLQSLVNKNLVKRIVENKKVYYRKTKGSL